MSFTLAFPTFYHMDGVKNFCYWITFKRCRCHMAHKTIMRPTTSDYKQLLTKKISSHREMAPSLRDKGGKKGGGHGSRRLPNHVVFDLIGHPNNIVFNVAPLRVLVLIGDGSMRSQGGGARLNRRLGVIVTRWLLGLSRVQIWRGD